MPDIRALYEKDFLGQWDVADKDMVLTIKAVAQEEIVQPKTNKTKKKVVLSFKETDKKMVLNATNRDTIAKSLGYGYNHTTWSGKKITLYKDSSIKFAKELVGGLRVRETNAKQTEILCESCKKPLPSNLYGMTASEWQKYCQSQNKPCRCKECIDKEKQ